MNRPVGILLVPIILIYVFHCNAFTWKCPENSQWFLRSETKCKDQAYSCLFDTKHSTYKEICRKGEDIGREGFKYILTPNPDQVPCVPRQYQPFTFTTNGNSQCVFRKSLCKSSGQILSHYGNSSTDVSCKCDYRQNYDYVISPMDPCYCKPAIEDCSCYIRKCNDDEVMIADYRCMKNVETILPEDIRCPIIGSIIPPKETVTVDMKQFQQISSSRTWSKQASVIVIVVIIIFTVLVGFLFFSVPHVRNILLKSELKLSFKRKENEFRILNGDQIEIECNVKSYFPVRSVTWQKEISGEIVQITEEKCEMNCRKRPSLTIYNFEAVDQGKYRCIVRNAIGLRNGLFSSCMNYMSSVGWLTRFVSVLQHIPAFHTEVITFYNYEIDSQLNPTIYNVYKGDEITMEQYSDDENKLVAVKWFKESNIWRELDSHNEQYSGGVPDVPSLTIKMTKLGNAGKYLCLLIYDNGKTQKAVFKLRMIPQVNIYKALLQHREDKTFIRPAICDSIDKNMQDNNIVVISGREGTGKSKICLELASSYVEKDFMIMKVDLSDHYILYADIFDTLIIIDDQQYTQDSLDAFMKHLLPILPEKNIKVILTCRNSDLEIVRRVTEIGTLNDDAFIDINNCLKAEEKEKIINRYLKVYNITTSSSIESNFRDPIILDDVSVAVTLDKDAIKVIRNEEPWKGFPLSASLFCSERKFLHLGEKYFTYPPIYLVKELKELYKAARKAFNCIDTVYGYCILVYIMKNKNHQLDLNDPDLCRNIVELYLTVFQLKYIPDKPGSNDDQKKAIEEAVHRMNNKYLKSHEGVYEFIHPCLLKAMYLSSDSMIPYLIQNGTLNDVTEFVRSEVYTSLENELVIKLDAEYHHILCERLARHAFENHALLLHVAQYIFSYWRLSGNNLVNMMFKYIEFILFNSLEVHTGDSLSLCNESVSENIINLGGPVRFVTVILLVDELTLKGRFPWIYGPGAADFLILIALVSAAMRRYTIDRKKTFEILLKEFQNRIHFISFVKLMDKPLDINGNTFFHYLMLFSEMEASEILNLYEGRKHVLDTKNVKNYTPLDIAAFLGKKKILDILNLRFNFAKKLRDRLKKLAESGQAEYHYANSKNITIDQQIAHKTESDSASPDKSECEDVNKDKKVIKDDIKKDKSLLNRTFSLRKEEPNKKEKHDVNDVLCFEDFLKNIVVFGEKEDYQLIVKLLS